MQHTEYKYLVVVINDGSPDRSGDIIAQYQHYPNLKVIEQENGPFSATNNPNAGLSITYLRAAPTALKRNLSKVSDIVEMYFS